MIRVLILDDMRARHEVIARRYPEDERVHVYTFDEAVAALATGRFDLVLLDHDLGEEHTGYHVALEIAALPAERLPLDAIVHSHNPVGAERMRDVLRDAGVRARCEPFSSAMAPVAAQRPPQTAVERLSSFEEACRSLPVGLSVANVIANLRVAGATKVETIYVLHRSYGIAVDDATSLVHGSETWSDRRAADGDSQDDLIAAVEALLAGGRKR